jgi:fructokinase
MYKIGIDLGGTKTEGIILDPGAEVVSRRRIPTRQELGYEQVLKVVAELYQSLVSEIDDEPHHLGMGTPGYVNKKGQIKNSSLLALNDQPFVPDIQKVLGRLPEIENDANCFAVAEALLGAGKGQNVVFGVILGTGCGGGLVVNNMLIRGYQYLGGEMGHMVLHPEGIHCFCGKKGCAERYISGNGIEERYQKLCGKRKALYDIVEEYRAGENNATEIMDHFLDDFGLAMSTLINILDPDQIVLGGGISNIDELYTLGLERVSKYVFKEDPEIRIARNIHGDSAGVIGAAMLHELRH